MRDLRGQRALVTGGAGFIGSHLVDLLIAEGWRVRVLDNLSRGHERNLDAARDHVELLRGDILDTAAVREACAGIDVVFHQAAIPSVPESVADPVGTHAVNVTGSLHVLEAARASGVRRVVFASSCATYGDDPRLPKREDHEAKPLSPYALQKLTVEAYCRLYSELHGLECVALRYFNVFGPRQDPASAYAAVVPLFVGAALRREPLVIYGDGLQTRDFVYVGDVAAANLRAAVAARVGQGEGPINIASGSQTSINALAAAVGECVGYALDLQHLPVRDGDITHSWADTGRAGEWLGFQATVEHREGLQRTVASMGG